MAVGDGEKYEIWKKEKRNQRNITHVIMPVCITYDYLFLLLLNEHAMFSMSQNKIDLIRFIVSNNFPKISCIFSFIIIHALTHIDVCELGTLFKSWIQLFRFQFFCFFSFHSFLALFFFAPHNNAMCVECYALCFVFYAWLFFSHLMSWISIIRFNVQL